MGLNRGVPNRVPSVSVIEQLNSAKWMDVTFVEIRAGVNTKNPVFLCQESSVCGGPNPIRALGISFALTSKEDQPLGGRVPSALDLKLFVLAVP